MTESNKVRTTKDLSYREALFTSTQICELLGISRTTFYEIKDKILKSTDSTDSSPAEKKLYDWNAHQMFSQRLADKIKKPKNNKVKVFANMKGGVGKSMLSTQVAMTSAAFGIKTLLIDFDPQGHSTLPLLGANYNEDIKTMYDVLSDGPNKCRIEDTFIKICPTLTLVPANLNLALLERKLPFANNREYIFSKAIDHLVDSDQFDLILIDTNPSVSLMNVNAYLASDEICIVVSTDLSAVHGLKNLFTIIKEMGEDFDFSPSIKIIPNLFDIREGHSQEALGLLRTSYGKYLTVTVVKKTVDFKSAVTLRQAVWQANKKRSVGSEDILKLTREIINESASYEVNKAPDNKQGETTINNNLETNA